MKIFKDKSKIDQVVDLLSNKGMEFFHTLSEDKVTIINEGNFKIKSIEILNKQPKLQIDFDNTFIQEISILSSIEHLDRVLYLYLYPKCVFPPHTDNSDIYYRIVTGVIATDRTEIKVLNKSVYLEKKQSIGFQANRILHSVVNYSNEPCTMLVLCLNENCFDIDEMIEIIG